MSPQAQAEALQLLRVAVHSWPQFDSDKEVSGADLVEWFADWRQLVIDVFEKGKP